MRTTFIFSSQQLAAIRRRVLHWYRAEGRRFPWRETRDPYVVLVSEIMLQQTQTSRVAEKLPAFLRKFPTLAALARAPRSAAIRAWQGMGYNQRAVHLHECARLIQRRGGAFPRAVTALRALPGVGDYTAAALACFAFGRRTPVADVNIRRVLSRLVARRRTPAELLDESETWAIARALLPAKNYYTWNQALMDIGATICLRRRARCESCPLAAFCASAFALAVPARRNARQARGKPEPAHNGVPNRLWRGRAVEILRRKKSVSLLQLGSMIDADFTREDAPWLRALLRGLQRDGLVRREGARVRLA